MEDNKNGASARMYYCHTTPYIPGVAYVPFSSPCQTTNPLDTTNTTTLTWYPNDKRLAGVEDLAFQVQCLIRKVKKMDKRLKNALKNGTGNNGK